MTDREAALEAELRDAHVKIRLLEEKIDALVRLKPRYLPQSTLGKAVAYAFEQWSRLEVFLENGAIQIDNNRVENAIRPTTLGAKNWLFLRTEASGKTSAILFSVIESAKRQGLEPYRYLKHLLETLPNTTNHQLHKLLPKQMAKAKNAPVA